EVNFRTRIDLHPESKLVAWEILCLGRPAAGELFQQGNINQRLELFIQQQRCFTDHLMIHGGSESLHAAWGLAGFPIVATMIIYPGLAVTTELLIAELTPLKRIDREEILSISIVNRLIVCRYLGYHGEQARQALTKVWALVRPLMLQKKAIKPRIWAT
ncbi:MAG: urease accessory protein UreD, partial [Thiohalomonadales bacterium]